MRDKLVDIFSGIVIALVSIPIAMGYAQIAGLPLVYGLYGSVLPIIVFGLLTSSKQFVVGVDAMPAVMVGGLLVQMGISAESKEAMELVPVISLLVALWFLIFYFFRAGRIVKYISAPVMGGFISGVGVTIILMQIPKLFGGKPGTGEVFVLLAHIWGQGNTFNPISFGLGIVTIVVILLGKKFVPRIPMTVVMLGMGALAQYIIGFDKYGVALLPAVEGGLPKFILPKVSILMSEAVAPFIPEIVMQALGIAAVVMAQSLLAAGSNSMKHGYALKNDGELLAYGAMNLAGAVSGCCPINGSVSRSGMSDSLGVKSQLMSLASGGTMILILLFGTRFFNLLPVPVLTGIVMTALLGIIDIKMLRRLWRESREELFIFILSFAGVLILGTVYGVLVGCLISFWQVAIRSVVPPTAFIGRIPGKGNFYSVNRNRRALPIKHTLIYRFSGNLFFANIDKFVNDIEREIIKAGDNITRQIVVDARAIGNIDVTAVDRLMIFEKSLKSRGIKFYISEHDGSLNDQLKKLGGLSLIENGVVRRTITLALRDAGLEKPYELLGQEKNSSSEDILEADDKLAELEWAFGSLAEEYMEKFAQEAAEEMADRLHQGLEMFQEHGARTHWGILGRFDEQEFWDHLEVHIQELAKEGRLTAEERKTLEEKIEYRRHIGEQKLAEMNPHALEILDEHREHVLEYLKERNIHEYEHLRELYNRR